MAPEFPEYRASKKTGTIDTPPPSSRETWQVLIVDPDQKNQTFIDTTLSQFVFKNRPISLLKVNSLHGAQPLFSEKKDIAVLLLHLSRETTTDGRWLIHYIRKSLKNQNIRIIIQTETFDSVSHQQMLEDDDIHDLFLDSEINSQKLNTVFTTALGAYQHIQTLHQRLRQNQAMENNFLESEQRFKDITISIGDLIWENECLMAQLTQVQRLEALGTLAGGIAHDFNNILGVILGYTQLLQMDVSSDSKTSDFTRKIIDSCNRAKNLTMQILDFSRLKEDEDQPHTPINPTSVVKEKLKMLRATIPSSIIINSDIPKRTGRVLATPNQIYQIITNLLTNAYQAMEDHQGSISIKMKDISLTAENYTPSNELNLPHGDYVTIEVEDNGKGITTELRDKIFDPYFTTKQGGDGRGLGLSVVYSIITRCKGAVVLDSQPGKGTQITLYLPAFPDEQKKNKVVNNAIATGEGKILFVDDEKMLVDLGKMMLERIGYQAVALQSPTEALATFQENSDSFDLVISDLTMPGLQGTQLAHEIKKIRPNIPVILATGFDSRTALAQDDNKDIDAVLSKPLSINALSETIKKFLK